MTSYEHPFDRVVRRLVECGSTVRNIGDSRVRANCPAHRDGKPSLCVTREVDRVLLKCFAGCKTQDVVSALGLRMRCLFGNGGEWQTFALPVAHYSYRDADGRLLAQKVRFEPKAFKWRVPDSTSSDGWSWGLRGGQVGLYFGTGLISRQSLLVLVEGEKAVDRLTRLGLPAACPPAGASSWPERLTTELLATDVSELAIIADADPEGDKHALRVAAAVAQASPSTCIRIVRLENLRPKGDVVDWLDAGGTLPQLMRTIQETPAWDPQAEEQRRAEIRRAKVRERVRRHRDRQRPTDFVPRAVRSHGRTTLAINRALSAVMVMLRESGQAKSGRAIKTGLARGAHSRAAIESALKLGVGQGLLTNQKGARGALLYRVSGPPLPRLTRGVTAAPERPV
jgi:hypothetical protein